MKPEEITKGRAKYINLKKIKSSVNDDDSQVTTHQKLQMLRTMKKHKQTPIQALIKTVANELPKKHFKRLEGQREQERTRFATLDPQLPAVDDRPDAELEDWFEPPS